MAESSTRVDRAVSELRCKREKPKKKIVVVSPRSQMTGPSKVYVKPSFTAKLNKNRNVTIPPVTASSSAVPSPHAPSRSKKTMGVNAFINHLAFDTNHWRMSAEKDHYRQITCENLGSKINRLHNLISYSIGWVMARFRPILDKAHPVYKLYTVSREYTIIDSRLKLVQNRTAGYLRGDVDFIVKDRETRRWCVIDIKTTEFEKTSMDSSDWLETAVMKRKNILQLRAYAVLVRRHFNLDYTPECYVLGAHIGATNKGFAVWKLSNIQSAVDLESAFSLWKDTYRSIKDTDFADT